MDQPEDVARILSDLDRILADLGESSAVPTPPASVEQPVLAASASVVAPEPEPEPPAPSPVEPPEFKVELAPRAGSILPLETPVLKMEPAAESPAPSLAPAIDVEPVVPAEAPAPTAAPADAVEEIPATAPKDQIRRVAYVYTESCAAARGSFEAFLSSTARTISAKPLYLRQALSYEIGAASDPAAVYEKAREAKAVVVVAVASDWPASKIDALATACARGGLAFHSVLPADAQRRSVAVDVLADALLLPGEA